MHLPEMTKVMGRPENCLQMLLRRFSHQHDLGVLTLNPGASYEGYFEKKGDTKFINRIKRQKNKQERINFIQQQDKDKGNLVANCRHLFNVD